MGTEDLKTGCMAEHQNLFNIGCVLNTEVRKWSYFFKQIMIPVKCSSIWMLPGIWMLAELFYLFELLKT